MKKRLKIQTNGLGQQSVALYLMSSLGVIPKLDYSIFADPGREKKSTYEYLEWLKEWAAKNSEIPLITVAEKSLYNDLMDGTNSEGTRFASIPAYTKKGKEVGMLKRQCTGEYKIAEVYKEIRKIYGIGMRQKFPPTDIYIAITVEEIDRMRTPDISQFRHVYPFCNYMGGRDGKLHKLNYDEILGRNLYTRADCISWLKKNGFPIPPKSSCTFCPYQSNEGWLDLKRNDPEEWAAVVELDKRIRNSSKKGVHQPIYLHESCKPLDQVNLQEEQLTLNFDCEGACHI